jgi:hypothetical protein
MDEIKTPAGVALVPGVLTNHTVTLPQAAAVCKFYRFFSRYELTTNPLTKEVWTDYPTSAEATANIDRAIALAFPTLPGHIRPLARFEWHALTNGHAISGVPREMLNANAVRVNVIRNAFGEPIGRFNQYYRDSRYEETEGK